MKFTVCISFFLTFFFCSLVHSIEKLHEEGFFEEDFFKEGLLEENSLCSPKNSIKGLLEAKVGYFRPTKKTFRRIYSSGPIYEIEGSIRVRKQLYAWTSVSYFPKSGSTIEGGSSTKIHLVPIGVGLKYLHILNSRNDSLYVGAGVLPTYLNTRDQSSFFVPKTVKWGVGALFKAGLIINLPSSFFLDFFADYMYLKMNFSKTSDRVLFRNRADLSGGSVGIGIGYCF